MLSLLLFYTGISLSTALIFVALTIWVNLTEYAIVVGAIAFSLSMIVLCTGATAQSKDD